MGCSLGRGRQKEERGGAQLCEEQLDDDGAGSSVLFPHPEGSEQACCLPFMGGDHMLWEVKGAVWVLQGAVWVLQGRGACLESVNVLLLHVVCAEPAS